MNAKNQDLELATLKLERDLYWRLLELGAQADLGPFLAEALALIVGVTGAKKGYLALYDDRDEAGDARFSIARGCTEAEVRDIRQTISQGIIARAMATGQTIHTASAQRDPRFHDNTSVRSNRIEAVLCAPVGANPPLGVLYLQGRDARGPFTDEDLRRAEAFARHLTPFVDRLMVKERARDDGTLALRQRLRLEGLIGRSRALADALAQLEGAARFDVPLLLTGASGTGKTAFARAIHDNSARARGPFVELNCAALPETLFESELFGAAQGAHSTATRKLLGKIAAAEGGTLFLDEVGETPLAVQAKLLQFLQSREYFPLGQSRAERADVRVITATNRDLAAASTARTFREDLYYRLNVMQIRVPSLAERRDDVALLAQHFCVDTCQRHRLPALTLTASAVRAAENTEWPGNVRQLAHAVEVAVIRAAVERAQSVERRHLFPELPPDPGPDATGLSFQELTRRYQRQVLVETLEATRWNISETARRLDLARSHIYNLVQAFDLSRDPPP